MSTQPQTPVFTTSAEVIARVEEVTGVPQEKFLQRSEIPEVLAARVVAAYLLADLWPDSDYGRVQSKLDCYRDFVVRTIDRVDNLLAARVAEVRCHDKVDELISKHLSAISITPAKAKRPGETETIADADSPDEIRKDLPPLKTDVHAISRLRAAAMRQTGESEAFIVGSHGDRGMTNEDRIRRWSIRRTIAIVGTWGELPQETIAEAAGCKDVRTVRRLLETALADYRCDRAFKQAADELAAAAGVSRPASTAEQEEKAEAGL